jgi:hypothetical protein
LLGGTDFRQLELLQMVAFQTIQLQQVISQGMEIPNKTMYNFLQD